MYETKNSNKKLKNSIVKIKLNRRLLNVFDIAFDSVDF